LQLKIIAEHQDISAKYLEQLMAVLKSAGIVRSVRGPRGGYILAKNPSEIKVSECFDCLEGAIITTECVDNSSSCPRATDCIARQLWIEFQDAISNVLQSKTLQNLIDSCKSNSALDYQI